MCVWAAGVCKKAYMEFQVSNVKKNQAYPGFYHIPVAVC